MGAGLELWGQREDGSEFPVEISLSPVHTEGGVLAAAAIRDATGRKSAQEQFRNLLETAPDAMVIINKQGEIVLVNKQTEKVFGYVREALIGKPVEVLMPEALRGAHSQHRNNYFTEPTVRGMGAGLELTGRRKNGTEFPIEISLSPLQTDEGEFATAAVRDITDRKRASEQLANLLEAAPDAMVIIDEVGEIKRINRQTEKLFGYKRTELIGKTVEALVPIDLRKGHVAHRENYFTQPNVREMGAGLELSGMRKDGSLFPIEISLSPLETDEGMWVTAAIRDVTDRKEAEQKIAEYAKNLELSNRELEHFAYLASHDLQAPLRHITNFSQLLKKQCYGKIDSKADAYFDFIEESADRMRTLIQDILELSRVNKSQRQLGWVDLTIVVKDACNQLSLLIDEQNVRLEVNDLPEIWGDHSMLVQLFQNLINNGIKFQPQTENHVAKIVIRHEIQGDFVRVLVEDNGIGIPADKIDKVFDIFGRLHNQSTYPGTGIGLAICKKIVEELHGGKLWVESSGNQGSLFSFTLPSGKTS